MRQMKYPPVMGEAAGEPKVIQVLTRKQWMELLEMWGDVIKALEYGVVTQ
jgi:hypothetical protein